MKDLRICSFNTPHQGFPALFIFVIALGCGNAKAQWVQYMFEANPLSYRSQSDFDCLFQEKVQIRFEFNRRAAVSYIQGQARYFEDAVRNFEIVSESYGSYSKSQNIMVGLVSEDEIHEETKVAVSAGNVGMGATGWIVDGYSFSGVDVDYFSSWGGTALTDISSFVLEFYFRGSRDTLPSLEDAWFQSFSVYSGNSSGGINYLTFCGEQLIEGDGTDGGGSDLGADCYDSLLQLPSSVTASRGDYSDRVEVTWTPVEGAEFYAIYRTNCGQVPLPSGTTVIDGPNPGFQPPDHETWRIATVPADQLSFSDTDLNGQEVCNLGPYLSWNYWVRAIRGGCLGQFPAIPQAEGYPLANPPHSLTATRGVFPDKVRLSWKVGRGTTGFGIYRGTGDDFAAAELLHRISSNFLVEGDEDAIWTWDDLEPEPGVEYFYWVEGYYRGGVAASLSLGVTEAASGYAGELNPNVPPTDIVLSNNRIAENNGPGTPIGDLIVTDPNEEDTHTFEVISVNGGSRSDFRIDGRRLVLERELDFETASLYVVKVQAADAGGLTFEKDLLIFVDDVDEPDPGSGDPPLLVKNLPSRLIATLGESISFEVVATGTLPMQFLWYKNGSLIGNGDGPRFVIDPVKESHGGKYHVKVINEAGEATSAQVNLFVFDRGFQDTVNQPPVIGLHGSPLIYLEAGQAYVEEGYTALDLEDGDLTDMVEVIRPDDTALPGNYMVTYLVDDSQGLRTEAQRAVIVREQLPSGVSDRQVARIFEEENVRVFVAPDSSIQSYSVKEVIPQGFSASEISSGGVWMAASNTIEWGPFNDNEPRTLSYKIREPDNYSGTVEITGTATFDNTEVIADGDQSAVMDGESDDNGFGARRVISQINQSASIEIMVGPEVPGSAYAVEEILPPGFTAGSINEGGVLDSVNNKVKWGPFFDAQNRTFSYALQAPAGYNGSVILKGFASVDGNDVITKGDNRLVFVSGDGQSISERTIESGVDGEVGVSISARPATGTAAYAVEEIIPDGFTATSISEGGAIDPVHNVVKWGPFLDDTARVFGYKLVNSNNSFGTFTITGFVSLDGVNYTVGGDQSFYLEDTTNPPDLTIEAQPVGGEAETGESFTFSVSVSGNVRGYQWHRNGQAIEGANLPFLIIADINPDDYGDYFVRITGENGSIDSNIATISQPDTTGNVPIIYPESITVLNIGDQTQMAFTVKTSPDKSYRTLMKSSLNDLSWTPVGPTQTASDDSVTFLINVTGFDTVFFKVAEE